MQLGASLSSSLALKTAPMTSCPCSGVLATLRHLCRGCLFIFTKKPHLNFAAPIALFLTLLPLLQLQAASAKDLAFDPFIIDYSKHPDIHTLMAHRTCIVAPDAGVDLDLLHRAGTRALAYISVVEVAPDAFYRKAFLAAKIPTLGKNSTWASDLVDIRSPAWKPFVLDKLAQPIAAKGFDGFFLDTPESIEYLIEKQPAAAESFTRALTSLVTDLKKRYPDKAIVLNRGFRILEATAPSVDAMLIESLVRTWDFEKKRYKEVLPQDREWLLERVHRARALGLPVLVADFLPPGQDRIAEDACRRIRQLGCIPFLSTPEFDGRISGPVTPVPRRILCVFGQNKKTAGSSAVNWPADSVTGLNLGGVLDWLGCAVDYAYFHGDALPDTLGSDYVALILDQTLSLEDGDELKMVAWIERQMRAGKKIIFWDTIPFNTPAARKKLATVLGMTIGEDPPTHFKSLGLETPEPSAIGFETKSWIKSFPFFELRAPKTATVLAKTRFTQNGTVLPFDGVFTAPWGGMALLPYSTFTRPDQLALFVTNPFLFFQRALGSRPIPVADTTTRDGLRIFFSHIDADGMSNISFVEPPHRSGEIVRDRVLKKYPLPFTTSIIGSELLGKMKNSKPEDAVVMPEIARSIFALPNIEAASHTFTHPFFWIPDDRTADLYTDQSVAEHGYNESRFNYHHEITESVELIDKTLLPPGKKTRVLLWSGNCRPHPDAIKITRQLGLKNMNGGQTIITKGRPSLTAVGQSVLSWGDQLQVQAPVQNDNIYTNGFSGPLFGGFSNAIQTFEMTELPRRMKPINVYYHYFSGDRVDSLQALITIFDWVMRQKTHALFASDYASLAEDAFTARVFRNGERFILTSSNSRQAWRLDESGERRPDLSSARGVAGWNTHAGSLYIAPSSPVAEFSLTAEPQSALRLISSSADLVNLMISPKQFSFSTTDFRPVELVFETAPNTPWQATVAAQKLSGSSDAHGRFSLVFDALQPVSVELSIP